MLSRSWHPYREIPSWPARIEAERGILEDLRLEPVPPRCRRLVAWGARRSTRSTRALSHEPCRAVGPSKRLV